MNMFLNVVKRCYISKNQNITFLPVISLIFLTYPRNSQPN